MENGSREYGGANTGLREQLVEALPQLRLYAKSLVPTFHDADDLVQKTCLKILNRPDLYDPDKPLLPWAITILKNLKRDEWRAEKKRGDDGGSEDISLIPDALSENRIEDNLELKNIDRLIQQLPEEQREVLVLSGGGQKYEEMAVSLGIPKGTVMSRLYRGRIALKKLMDEPTHDEENVT